MSKLPKLSQDQIAKILDAYRADPRNPLLAQAAAAVAELGQARKSLGKGAKARATLTSSDTDEWNTPNEVLDIVRKVGAIGLDPFFNRTCSTAPALGLTKADNSLERDWLGILQWAATNPSTAAWRQRARLDFGEMPIAYSNPPYSIMEAVSVKVVTEARRGIEHISLVKAATETEWFDRLVWSSARAVLFFRGRLSHREAESAKTGPATFASVLAYHGVRTRRFAEAARPHGKIVLLNGGV